MAWQNTTTLAQIPSPVQLWQWNAQALGAGATISSPVFTSQYQGYEIGIEAQSLDGLATNPFCKAIITWYEDSAATLPVKRTAWYFAMGAQGNAAPLPILGTGPMRGAYCQIQIVSLDTKNGQITLNFLGASRTYSRDDWRETFNAATGALTTVGGTGNTRPSSDPDINLIWFINSSIGAGASIQRLLPLASGLTFLRLACSGLGGNTMQFEYFEVNNAIGDMFNVFLGGAAIGDDEQRTSPHDHMYMKITNGSAGAGTARSSGILLEY